jgi:hypothetical protein
MKVQSTGQKEVIAYLVDHRTRLNDVSNKLGWLEVDLKRADQKSDELLLLVRELAASVNSRNDNTAIICISIPRSLYNPSLSIYRGVRPGARTQYTLLTPGSSVPTPNVYLCLVDGYLLFGIFVHFTARMMELLIELRLFRSDQAMT